MICINELQPKLGHSTLLKALFNWFITSNLIKILSVYKLLKY